MGSSCAWADGGVRRRLTQRWPSASLIMSQTVVSKRGFASVRL